MRRRLLILLLGLVTTLGLAIPAHADPGVTKDVFIEDFQGTTPLDDPSFADCLGYQGQIYEDRHGVYNLTIHTRGSMAGVVHVEGDVNAAFTISPVHATGVVYRGTYREHATGNFLVINDQDVPTPPRPTTCTPPAPAATDPRSASPARATSSSTSEPARSAATSPPAPAASAEHRNQPDRHGTYQPVRHHHPEAHGPFSRRNWADAAVARLQHSRPRHRLP